MKNKKPLYKKIFKFLRNIFFILILKSVWRKLFRGIRYRIFCHQLRKAVTRTGNPVIIYVNSFDYYSKIPQRPNHMFNILADKGYPCVFCSTKKRITKPRENLFVVPTWLLLKILNGDFPKVFDVSFSFPYSKIQNFLQYINDKTLVIYEFIDDFNLLFDPQIIIQAKNLFVDLIKRENTFVLASADLLYNEAKELGAKNLILSKNAVNINDFLVPPTYTPTQIEKYKKQGKIIAGYYGAITASWFDFALLHKLLEQHSDIAFILIGLIYTDDNYEKTTKYIDELSKYDNFVYIPPIKYQDIPNYAKHWDVATIPFKINDITKSTSPVKLFEYMAMGLPIVTTPMEECKLYKSVFIANDTEEFVLKIMQALSQKKDKKYQETLKLEANGNTWEKRVTDMIEIIEKHHKG